MIKFNGGIGAILCDICSVIIKENLTIDESHDTSEHFCSNHQYLKDYSEDTKYFASFISENHSLDGYVGVRHRTLQFTSGICKSCKIASHGILDNGICLDCQTKQNVIDDFIERVMLNLDELFDPEFDIGELKIWDENNNNTVMTNYGVDLYTRCKDRYTTYALNKFGNSNMLNKVFKNYFGITL